MIIQLTYRTSLTFIHTNLLVQIRQELASVNVALDQLTVTSVSDDEVTVNALVHPGAEHTDLTQDEVRQLCQDAIS